MTDVKITNPDGTTTKSSRSSAKLPIASIKNFLDLSQRAIDGGTPCRRDPELFFSFQKSDIAEAKDRCLRAGPGRTRCPILMECARFAIDAKQNEGVWGAMDPAERARIRRHEKHVGEKRRRQARAEAASGQTTIDTQPTPEPAPARTTPARRAYPHARHTTTARRLP